jgi:hypothetical protein
MTLPAVPTAATYATKAPKNGCVGQSVGEMAVENDTSWKSPRAGLFHCAWKSARAADFHSYHRPGDGELTFLFSSGKKNS